MRPRSAERLPTWSAGLAIVALLAWAAPASAAPVVLYGPGLDGASAAERVRGFLGDAPFVSGGSIEDQIKLDEDAVLLLGLEPALCKAPDRSYEALEAELVSIRESLDQMDYAPIFLKARLARDKLPCTARGSRMEDIYDLFFIGGLAAGFEGNEDEARDWFAAAAAIQPSKQWPSRHSPELRPLYLEGL